MGMMGSPFQTAASNQPMRSTQLVRAPPAMYPGTITWLHRGHEGGGLSDGGSPPGMGYHRSMVIPKTGLMALTSTALHEFQRVALATWSTV